MIHELRVSPEMSVESTKKLARKLAMTGGYEVVVPSSLSKTEREELKERWRYHLEASDRVKGESAYRASLAGRILAQLEEVSFT